MLLSGELWFSSTACSCGLRANYCCRMCAKMATSKMKVSPNDYHCKKSCKISEGSTHDSQLGRNSKCENLSSYELDHAESCEPELKPEWLQSKDAIKRKRVNRTAKLKQCKLDARREQWLSQGSHSRAKHVDEDCHDTVARKGNDERHQVSPTVADRLASIQTPECGQNIDRADNEGRELSTSTAIDMHAGSEKQAIPVKWRDRNLLQLRELDCSNSVTDKAIRSTVDQRNDDSLTAMQKNCLTDTSDNFVLNFHGSHITLTSKSNATTIEKEAGIILAGGSLCRKEVSGRSGEEIFVDNMQKQGQGFENMTLTHSHASAIQLNNTCTDSRCAEGLNDDSGHSHPHDGEDDWEAVADAIYMQGAPSKIDDTLQLGNCEIADSLERKGNIVATMELRHGALQPEYKYKAAGLRGRTRAMDGRAWRPDDAARPPTLPRLSDQHSFPLLSTPPGWSELRDSNLWGPPPAPLFCPICTEELDLTDSSFVPCSCGFRLCLFCHHRIAADDGRCPGCRKTYNSDVAMKLSRASSLWLQI